MSTKETIRNLTIRARMLGGVSGWNEDVEDAYWKIKHELFDALRLWSYGHVGAYPLTMQADLDELNRELDSLWHKKFA